jgi:hypothetical protein
MGLRAAVMGPRAAVIMDKLKEQKLISHDLYIERRYSEGCIEEQYKTKTETDRSCKLCGKSNTINFIPNLFF